VLEICREYAIEFSQCLVRQGTKHSDIDTRVRPSNFVKDQASPFVWREFVKPAQSNGAQV
jgi:hypothetical protein